MGKGPKLQISLLNSIQICRPKDPSSMFISPLPALTHFSKTYDISLPSFPDPPPSPPDYLPTACSIESSKTAPLGIEIRSKSCLIRGMTSGLNDEFSSHANFRTRKDDKGKMHNTGPFPSDRARPVRPSRIEAATKKPKAKASTSISVDDKDESDNLSSNEEEPLNRSEESVKQTSVRTRRFKRFGSKEWKDGIMIEPENESREREPVSGRLVPCKVDTTVNQSFVVVKRSVDPYEDLKKSMLEMILEKQINRPKELEQLLMSFLSLNSRIHHKAILKAFTEIWKEVFSGSSN